MRVDNLTRLLLAAIAVALWMIALNPWLRPVPVAANQEIDLSNVEAYLSNIQDDVSSIKDDVSSTEDSVSSIDSDVGKIAKGTCTNDKIC